MPKSCSQSIAIRIYNITCHQEHLANHTSQAMFMLYRTTTNLGFTGCTNATVLCSNSNISTMYLLATRSLTLGHVAVLRVSSLCGQRPLDIERKKENR